MTEGGIVGDGVEFQSEGYVEAGAIGDYNLAFKTDMTLSTFARVDSVPSGSWGGSLLTYGTADYYTEDEETNYSYWLSILSDGTLLAFWEYEWDQCLLVLDGHCTDGWELASIWDDPM